MGRRDCERCVHKPDFYYYSPVEKDSRGICKLISMQNAFIYKKKFDGVDSPCEGFFCGNHWIKDCPEFCASDDKKTETPPISDQDREAIDELWAIVNRLRKNRGVIA